MSAAKAARWLRTIDEWRRLQPEIPTRAKAVRLMIEAVAARDAPAADQAKAPAKRKGAK